MLPRTPEFDVLIACASPPGHPDLISRVRSSLAVPVDWNRLQALATYHRVQPLLYRRLAEHAADLIPNSLLTQIATGSRAFAARNLYLTGELITLVKAFTAAQIPVRPHTGPLLAQAAYGDLALRQFADLDLLVHPSDLPQAIALLSEQGYSPDAGLSWLSPSALRDWTGEMSYTSPRGTVVDLHWRLTPPHYVTQLNSDILWRSLVYVTLAGSALPSLAPEAMFLLLAVHGSKHNWEALGWLADLAWLLHSHPDFDWHRAAALARESDCERPLALAQSLIDVVFKGQPSTNALTERVLNRWRFGPTELLGSLELFSFAAAIEKRRSKTLNHLLGVVFWPTAADWKRRRLPERLFWLYAPLRAARLTGKYLLRTSPLNLGI